MSRYVFDTNAIVSALPFNDSVPDTAFSKALTEGTILASISLVEELRDVLARPRFDAYVSYPERIAFLQAFVAETELVTVNEAIQVCRDPKDDRVLEAAVNGQAEFIVTGDSDLLVHNPFRGIAILPQLSSLISLPSLEQISRAFPQSTTPFEEGQQCT